MKHNDEHMRLCGHCLWGIQSRGEKVFALETLEYNESYEDWDEEEQGYLTCEWCEEEMSKEELYYCVF